MAPPLRILFAASECAPLAKAGGLGDVVGALPKVLKAEGHDVRILLPRYAFISTLGAARHPDPLGVPLGSSEAWCAVFESRLPGSDVPLYFLEHDALFDRSYIYDPPGGHAGDNLMRFGLLGRGALQLPRYLGWVPDVIHVHDWPTAAVPVMLNQPGIDGLLLRTATVLTIHNIAYQPLFPRSQLDVLGISPSELRPDGLEDRGAINVFKGGLYHATMLTTVSPTYAREIRTPEGAGGLAPVMSLRGADLVGILNGIDEDVWNPRTDPYLPAHFSSDDLNGKAACKAALQRELHLVERPEVPLIGVISRLNPQKGTDVILEALDEILGLDAQVIILGAGDTKMEQQLRARSQIGGDRFRAWIGLNESLAHRIEAGADMFLMPSRFEPCGLNQMYSQRYGTVPIVRATGGLEDTVEGFDERADTGTGFKMRELSKRVLADTVRLAVEIYRTKPALFRKLQRRGMMKQFGWQVAAKRYAEVYRWAIERRSAAHP
jgi:starch synthase